MRLDLKLNFIAHLMLTSFTGSFPILLGDYPYEFHHH